jgi:GAF domain-containing protein
MVVSEGYYERGIDEEEIRSLYFPIQDVETLRTMVETKKPYLVSDVSVHPGWIKNEITKWVRSYVGAPIFVEDDVIGFINLDSENTNFFDQSIADQLQGFANQVALPIRNARIYEYTRRQGDLMGQVSADLQRATAVEDVIETAIRSLNTAFPDYDIRLRLKPRTSPDKTSNEEAGR